MDLTAQYAGIVFPDRVRVLGCKINALSIGHVLMLNRRNSPFVTGAKAEVSDIAEALFILSRPYQKAALGLNSAVGAWLIHAWGLQLKLFAEEAHIARATVYLRRVIAQAYEGPPLWESNDAKGKACNAPYLMVVTNRLMSLGVSREDALAYPLRQAIWDIACRGEDQGNCEWVSSEESEAIDHAMKGGPK